MRKIIIVGATSLIAQHCARRWVTEAPVEMVLLGRNLIRLEQVAQDLRVRSAESKIQAMEVGFLVPEAIHGAVGRAVALLGGHVDLALIAHGHLPDQQQCQEEVLRANDALLINGVSPVLFAEAIATVMQGQGAGTLGMIGSVAGDRGRKSNYIYGAAKSLVSTYAEGLQHRFADTAIRITLIKPGPTDTPMTAHLQGGKQALADPAEVAALIVAGMATGKATVYAPRKWRLIMWVIRHLPTFIFNRLNI